MDFLKSSKRFSFKLGGIDAWSTNYECQTTETENQLISVYTFESGLRITNTATKYEEFGAYEWVNKIENISASPTYSISELYDCDIEIPLGHESPRKWSAYLPDPKQATKIFAASGSTWKYDEFNCNPDYFSDNKHPNHITLGETKKYSCHGGRSSDVQAPFFNIFKQNTGCIFAIGWSGQWNCEISRKAESISFKSGIQDAHFCVMPGEEFRTSSVVILPYSGSFIDSQNKWRKLVKKEFSLIGKDGRPKNAPLCAGIWGGMKTESVLHRIEKIEENSLPFEYVWMDAGWYGADTLPTPDEFEGNWGEKAGDWRISKHIHPGELQDVSQKLHAVGMKFLLWFETERARTTAPIVSEHPEYFLSASNRDDRNRLLNLGNSDAWHYCFDLLSGMITKLNLSCYRCDFNFSPLPYWQNNDSSERKGICEIKYINGLYRLWDALLEKHPGLIIDNCASGGRRIDIETLRRSVPLWRSDIMCPANYDAEAAQAQTQSFNLWMPYSGTGSGRIYDEYRVRSAYAAAMTTNYSFSERNAFCEAREEINFIKKYMNEYLLVRPYFSEDFYPLTEFSDKLDVWCANQFNRPSQDDGMIQVFRRENSPYESARFKLQGIDSTKNYIFTDLDSPANANFTLSGKELCENGFEISVSQQCKAKIYLYKVEKQ